MKETRKYHAITEKGYLYVMHATSMKVEDDNIVFYSGGDVIGLFPAKTTSAHRVFMKKKQGE